MADVLQDRYDDPSLSCVIQPVPLVFPWLTLPVAADFPEGTTQQTVPTIEWVVELFEADARTDLANYLSVTVGGDFTEVLNALPGSYVSYLYRNVYGNLREENPDVLCFRLDYEFATPTHAIPAAWLAYHLGGLLQEPYVGATDNEGLYRFKLLNDIRATLATFLYTTLTANPTVAKDPHLILCNLKVQGDRQTVFVDQALLSKYLTAGGTIKALCDNWVNAQINPQP